jgi:hypothetical protein
MPAHTRPDNQRRYDLHLCLRRAGVKIKSRERTIVVPANAFYTTRTWIWIRELQKMGYAIQISIPDRKPKIGSKRYRYFGNRRSAQFNGQICYPVINTRPVSAKEVFVWFETGETCRVKKNNLKAIENAEDVPAAVHTRVGLDYLNTLA